MRRFTCWTGGLIAVVLCAYLAAPGGDDWQLHPLKARGTAILGRAA